MPSSTPPPPAWRELRLARHIKPKLPPLFYKAITTSPPPSTTSNSPSLVLHLTDLTTLWTASLTHADILTEATRNHSPIDPSESTKQFTVLLDYLVQSLASNDNLLARHDEPTSTASISNPASPPPPLTLQTTTPLPRPLRPFTFSFPLTPQPPPSFSRILLIPALQASQNANCKFEALLEVVRDKDHVIAKLLERVGAQANGDMSLVFPTLTGKRGKMGEGGKVGVKEAGRWVPGLEGFERGRWDGEVEMNVGEGGGVEGLVMSGDGGRRSKFGVIEDASWVGRLPGLEALEDETVWRKGSSWQVTRENTMAGEEDEDKTGSEDEFERQPTPPSVRKNARATVSPRIVSAKAQEKDTRMSASDDKQPTPATKQKTTDTVTKRGGKLGGLGRGKKTTTPLAASSRSSSAEPQVQTRGQQERQPLLSPAPVRRNSRQSNASTATATESENEPEPKSSRKRKSPSTPSPSPPATRARARSTSAPSSSASPEPEKASSTSSRTPAKGKINRLGRIGRKTRTPSPAPSASSVREPRSRTQQQGTPSHRLGKLGLRNRKGPAASPSPAGKTKLKPQEEAETNPDGDDTATESEDEDLDAPSRPKTRRTRAAAAGDDAVTAGAPEHGRETKSPPPSSAAGKESAASEDETRKEVEKEEKEPETAEEAATRRREELKRTAAQAPARKKRRF